MVMVIFTVILPQLMTATCSEVIWIIKASRKKKSDFIKILHKMELMRNSRRQKR